MSRGDGPRPPEGGDPRPGDDQERRVAAARAVMGGLPSDLVAEMAGLDHEEVDRVAAIFLEAGTRAVVALGEHADPVTLVAFACHDVVPGCPALFWAADVHGILAQVAEHARDAHGMHDLPDRLVGQVTAAIQHIV